MVAIALVAAAAVPFWLSRWGLQPNRDWDQRWDHYARYDHANEQSGGYWGYQQARAKGQGEEDGGKGKWRSWD